MGYAKLTTSSDNSLQFFWNLSNPASEVGSIALGLAIRSASSQDLSIFFTTINVPDEQFIKTGLFEDELRVSDKLEKMDYLTFWKYRCPASAPFMQ
jgi:hypothetical protein